MSPFLAKSENCLHFRITLILINVEIQNIDYINRAKGIISTPRSHLVSNLKRRIINRAFHIGILLTSLHLDNNPCTVICLTEHVINRILLLPVHGFHFLVHKLQVYNRPVINHLIQELDHHVLTGLLTKYQLEDIVVQQVRILEFVKHKSLFLRLTSAHCRPH